MTNKLYSAAAGLALIFSFSIPGVQAQSSIASPSGNPVTNMERARRSFGSVQPRGRQGKDAKVPSSMDLFVDRCTQAGGGLISIDGHYDCVRPSGEPIPDW